MKKDVPKEFLEKYYQKKESLDSELKDLEDRLKLRLGQLKKKEGTRARITDARVKRPGKIWKKAIKYGYSPSEAFEKIIDILGIRIVCNNLSDTQSVIDMLKLEGGVLEIKEIKDMVSEPMDDGYRAIHVRTLTYPLFFEQTERTPCEIQIRTLSQDTWARFSRADLYGKKSPQTIAELTKVLSEQLVTIDKTAQLIRNELDKPAEKARDIKDSDPISPQRLALLYKQMYDDDLYEWSLHDWVSNLEEAEVKIIKEVKDLLGEDHLRKKLDDIVKNIRGYPLEDSEWVVYSAKVASEVSEEEGIKAVTEGIESEWDEISSFALREILPATIEDFLDELEFSLSATKDAEDSSYDIKTYFSLLDCMSKGIYGEESLDEICAIEAILSYYEDDHYEERLGELISAWEMRYG